MIPTTTKSPDAIRAEIKQLESDTAKVLDYYQKRLEQHRAANFTSLYNMFMRGKTYPIIPNDHSN